MEEQRLEAISKTQIVYDGKAKADEKAQHTREYVSILKRCSTQPSGTRWCFEMASILTDRGRRIVKQGGLLAPHSGCSSG